MDKIVKPSRLVALILIIITLTFVSILNLYKVQILDRDKYTAESRNTTTSNNIVPAARGNIYDRYGRLMVNNRTCNNLMINIDDLFEQEDPNGIILELIRAVQESGGHHTDTLPITMTPPFEYEYDLDKTNLQTTLLNGYLEANDLPASTTAVELMAFFRNKFDIDTNYTAEETRLIAGVRYELRVRYIVPTSDYVFANDVSMDLITQLMEQGVPGFRVESSFVREYNTTAAAHVLGYVGSIEPGEVEKYKNDEYPLDALVGRVGIEKAFEEYLHGVDGEAVVTSTRSGTVLGTTYTKEVEPGNNVFVTLDVGLQEAAEAALATNIEAINAKREENNAKYEDVPGYEDEIKELVPAGAVVAIEVNTGEPLCIASYPDFDLSTLLENFTEIASDEAAPMFNRALMGTYAPGSTFKPMTALCALDTGIIDVNTTFNCVGIFDKYADKGYAPKCWAYPYSTHGDMNVVQGIENSCNYFFYSVADLLESNGGIDVLAEYASHFGLGEKTGIELDEEKGIMASTENKKKLYPDDPFEQQWFTGNTLAACIGQSISLFTPIQLANYMATVANGGTHYSASLLKSVRSYDNSETIFEREPKVMDRNDFNPEYYNAVRLGMNLVVTSGVSQTVHGVFSNVNYTLGAKTGTAEMGEGSTNNATFICFAPYENPEIAVAVVLEKGGAGAELAVIAKEVLDYWYNFKNSTSSVETENNLLK